MIRNKVQIIRDNERVIVRNTDTDKLLTSESVSICLRVSWLHKRHRWLTYHFLRLRLRDSQLHLLHRNRLPLERKKMKGIRKKVTKWKGIKVNGKGGGGSGRSNISLENEIQKWHRRSGRRRQDIVFFFFCLLTLRLINRFQNDERRFKRNKFMSWLYRDNPVIQFE